MKKVSFFFFLFFLVLLAHSQSPVAITVGIHGSTVSPHFLTYPDTVTKQSTGKAGMVVGITANVPITRRLFFRAGVLYSAKGSNWSQFYDSTNLYARTATLPQDKKKVLLSTTTQLNVNYIDIPLNLLLKLPLKGKSKFVMGAGPQLSILFNGYTQVSSIHISQTFPDEDAETFYTQEDNDDLPIGKLPGRYRVVHLGANAFGGMEFGRVLLTVNYSRGINEFYEEEGRKFKHQTIGGSIGIYLGKRQPEAAGN